MIPSTGFQSADLEQEDRFPAWVDYLSPGQEIRPVIQDTLQSPFVSSSGWAVDDLTLTELSFTPIIYRRRAGNGQVLIRMYQTGHARGMHEDEAFSTAPGEVHMFDQGSASTGDCDGWQSMKSVFMPYEAVHYQPGHHPRHIRVGADTASGRILRTSMASLFSALPDASASEAPVLASGFCGLVHGLLLARGPAANDSTDFHAARRRAMRRYLEERLGDPELGVDQLCAAFSVSRATVYRDFAEEGGVARFVTRCRLERAFRDLSTGAPDRGRVRRVAERWGFASQYHFSRLFRQQFGASPSAVSWKTLGSRTS